MSDISNHILATVKHPVISVNNSVTQGGILDAFREKGVSDIGITGFWHISEYTINLKMKPNTEPKATLNSVERYYYNVKKEHPY